MKLRYGLSEEIIADLQNVFAKHPGVDHVDLYGSRGRGDFKSSSDIDLALYGTPTFSDSDFSRLWLEIEGLPIVFKIDLIDMNRLTNDKLAASVKREGIRFWPEQTTIH